jgi:protein-L-isoaspartate O-methyltransferase
MTKKENIDNLLTKKRLTKLGYEPKNMYIGLKKLCDDALKINKKINIVELGCCQGGATKLFALMFKSVVTIDAWDEAYKEGYRELSKDYLINAEQAARKSLGKYKNVTIVKGFSDKVAQNYEDDSFDMIYIDSAHDYKTVKKELIAWLPKVKKGGILSGHDFKNILGVRQAVIEVIGRVDKLYEDTSWMVVNDL